MYSTFRQISLSIPAGYNVNERKKDPPMLSVRSPRLEIGTVLTPGREEGPCGIMGPKICRFRKYANPKWDSLTTHTGGYYVQGGGVSWHHLRFGGSMMFSAYSWERKRCGASVSRGRRFLWVPPLYFECATRGAQFSSLAHFVVRLPAGGL